MAEELPKKRRGCLFWGAISLLALFLLMVLGILFGLRVAKKVFTDFTDTRPQPLPAVQMEPARIKATEEKINDFRTAVRAHRPVQPLELTADEINALIANDPDMQAIKGKLFVTIDGDQLKGQLSIPMEDVGLTVFKGRYLNGSAIFDVSVRDGELRITARDVVVKGRALPDIYLKEIRKHNLAKALNSDRRVSAALERLNSVQVKDGKLIIVPNE